MLRQIRLNLLLVAVFVTAASIAVPLAAANDDVTPPLVPTNLQVPEGHQAYLIGHANGTQNHTCVLSASGFMWAFHGPPCSTRCTSN